MVWWGPGDEGGFEGWAVAGPGERVGWVVGRVVDGVTARAGEVRGLGVAEIEDVEGDQDAPVGAAYRAFLALAGGGAGRLLQGSVVFYPDVLGLGAAARALLAENRVPFTLTGTDRVFFMHQGYQFHLLRGSDSDPEVWAYCEGDDAPAPVGARFTDWLDGVVREETAARARLARGRRRGRR